MFLKSNNSARAGRVLQCCQRVCRSVAADKYSVQVRSEECRPDKMCATETELQDDGPKFLCTGAVISGSPWL